MKAPSSETGTRYDITSGAEEVCWEGKAGTWRTGERRAFKTFVDSTDKTPLRSCFSFLIHIDIRPLKMHVLYAFCFGCTCYGFFSQA